VSLSLYICRYINNIDLIISTYFDLSCFVNMRMSAYLEMRRIARIFIAQAYLPSSLPHPPSLYSPIYPHGISNKGEIHVSSHQ
jgi:hypothetical protein